MKIRIAGMIADSIVDGPGIRLALFVQGCPHHCRGCHNPATHDPAGGTALSPAEIMERIKAAGGIDGVTFTGGEPFEQARPLALLAQEIMLLGLNLVLYSGYTFEELLQRSKGDPDILRLLEHGLLLIDGPYKEKRRDPALPYRGSANQRVLDLPLSLQRKIPVIWPVKGYTQVEAKNGQSQ